MSTDDAWYMADKLREILQSRHFAKDDFHSKALKLSQAFCLLWQDKETGEVSGRQKPGRASNAAVVAVLLDLFILKKIEFEACVKQWTSMRRRREIVFVKVCDATPTDSFLDSALFSSIISHHHVNPKEPKTVTEWIIQGSGLSPTSSTAVLDSLVDDNIFGKTSILFWKKYPTLNPEPEMNLIKEIRNILLDNHVADGFMWTLIKLLCCVDDHKIVIGSILTRYFSMEELSKGIPQTVTALIRGEDDQCVNVLKIDEEFNELREMTISNSQKESKRPVTYSAPEACAEHDVDLIIEEKTTKSRSEEPQLSSLISNTNTTKEH